MCNQQSIRSACAYGQSDQSLCKSLEYSRSVKLLTEHHLEFLSLKGGGTGSSESALIKMPHCWKSHIMAQISCFSSNYCRKTYLPWDVHSKDGTISLLECHCSVLQYIRSARSRFVNGKCWWCVWTRSLSETLPSSSNSERKASILI